MRRTGRRKGVLGVLSDAEARKLRIKARHEMLTPEEQALLDEYMAMQSASGKSWAPEPRTAPGVARDSGSFGWAVLGFFIPLAGLVLWLVWRDGRPLSASRAGKGALVGFIVGAILFVLMVAAMLFFAGGAIMSAPPEIWDAVPDIDIDGVVRYSAMVVSGLSV